MPAYLLEHARLLLPLLLNLRCTGPHLSSLRRTALIFVAPDRTCLRRTYPRCAGPHLSPLRRTALIPVAPDRICLCCAGPRLSCCRTGPLVVAPVRLLSRRFACCRAAPFVVALVRLMLCWSASYALLTVLCWSAWPRADVKLQVRPAGNDVRLQVHPACHVAAPPSRLSAMSFAPDRYSLCAGPLFCLRRTAILFAPAM